MNWYKALRTIHFYSAVLTAVFLLLFFITGYLINRYNWFDHRPVEPIVRTYEREIPNFPTDRALAHWVKKELKITGKIDWIGGGEVDDKSIEIVTPKLNHMIKVSKKSGKLVHETRQNNTFEMLSVMHRVHGYGGGLWYDIYLFAMDLASLALLIFAISGIYLWLRLLRMKWLGWLILGLGLVYTLIVVSSFFN